MHYLITFFILAQSYFVSLPLLSVWGGALWEQAVLSQDAAGVLSLARQ